MDAIHANVITESGIDFGPFDSKSLYYVEKSLSYRELGSGFSTVEFVCLRNDRQLCFLEAKSSSPRSDNSPDRFERYIREIADKFLDSYQMFLAVHTGRRAEPDMGADIRFKRIPEFDIKFVLVIPEHREDWLPPIRSTLTLSLRKIAGLWNIGIVVMNKQLAREYGLTA